MSTLPVYYCSQPKAWTNQTITLNWFNDQFVPKVRNFLETKGLPKKAILLVDNAPSHPTFNIESDDGEIVLRFLPANTTPLIQPMDQGVIESLKRYYRKLFIERLLNFLDQGN